MNKLFIDTATQSLILVIMKNDKVDQHVFEITNLDHSERLMPAIEQAFEQSELNIQDIDAFYISQGPGSYTGVRIGVTVAKMFAYTLNKPLYAISSLSVMASPYLNQAKVIVPIIDARRGNVFGTIYQVMNNQLESILDEGLYSIDELISLVSEKALDDVLFVGLDTEKFSEQLEEKQIRYTSQLKTDFKPIHLFEHLSFKLIEDIHGFSPNYSRVTEAERNLQNES